MQTNSYSFLQALKLNPEAENRVSLFLRQVELGSETVLRSAIGKSKDSEQILSDWDQIFNSNSSKMSEDLLVLEGINRSTFSPRSLALPWSDRLPGVKDYFSPESSFISPDPIISLSRRLRPLSLDKALLYLKSNTNSGLPFVTKKCDIKASLAVNFNSLLERKDPCILFTRTQESMKTRNVWGYPVADTLNEMRFYRPLLEFQRALPWRSALLSPEATDLTIDSIIKTAISNKESIVSIDFSSYDATVKTRLQDCAFNYISSLYQRNYEEEISYIKHRFNEIGLITPYGILNGPHGVPSGSTFTNEVDSIVQFICASDFGIMPNAMNIQGDDGVYRTSKPDELVSHFGKFGLKPNDVKSYISNDKAIYLQNLYSLDYQRNGIVRGVYPTYRALGRILFPERYDQYNDEGISGASFNSLRAISILENCRYHPLFPELVKFVKSLDKYKLCFNGEDLDKYVNWISSSQGVEGIFNYRYGDSISKIYDFDTVKLLSKL